MRGVTFLQIARYSFLSSDLLIISASNINIQSNWIKYLADEKEFFNTCCQHDRWQRHQRYFFWVCQHVPTMDADDPVVEEVRTFYLSSEIQLIILSLSEKF